MNTIPAASVRTQSLGDDALQQLLDRLPQTVPFDAAALIAERPELRNDPQLVVDLAYEEFSRRQQQGEAVEIDAFISRFPEVSSLLRRTLEICEFIAHDPDLFLRFAEPGWPAAGDRLGPFVLDRQIGAGAFSRVYQARERTLGNRDVVLKLTTHVLHEAQVLGRLNHPQIVSPLGIHADIIPGLTAIAMPFLGRATVGDLVKACHESPHTWPEVDYRRFLEISNGGVTADRGTIGPKRRPLRELVLTIGTMIAEALAHAHSRGFIHCDVKPSNILLGLDGTPRLLDFNLSIALHDGESFPSGGTLDYMAPEHVRVLRQPRRGGRCEALTGVADVFSLAATLVELLTGHPPYRFSVDNSSEERFPLHPLDCGAMPFRLPRGVRRHVGNRVAVLLESCLDRDPLARPSAERLATELRALLPSTHIRRILQSRRGKSAILVGSIAIAALVWALRPPSLQAQYERGWLCLTQKANPKRASHEFTRILAADPSRTDVRLLRACALIEARQFEEAYTDLWILRQQSPAPEISQLLGYVHCAWNRRFEHAEREYETALTAGIASVDVLNNLAYCKDRLSKLDEAKRLLQRARQQEPSMMLLHHNLAYVELRSASETGTRPDASIADDLMQHEQARVDPGSLLCAAQIYLHAAGDNRALSARGLALGRRAASLGIPRPQLQGLGQTASALFADPTFRQELDRVPASDRQLGLSLRLLAPPVSDPSAAARLVAAVTPAISDRYAPRRTH